MVGNTELQFVNSQIGKAETRLAFQSAIVARLPVGTGTKEASVALQTLRVMEDRMATLYKSRADLLALAPATEARGFSPRGSSRTIATKARRSRG